jgi:surfactin synthase thioesterase subunit
MPDSIEVCAAQYPGREDRLREPFVSDMGTMAAQLADEAALLCDLPVALFGHSLGGAIAHEVALLLEQRGIHPVHLFVSGREPAEHCKSGTVHEQDEEGIKAELERLSVSNRALVRDAALWSLILPVVRNDYALVESYRPEVGRRVSCPLTVFLGDSDRELTAEEASDWRKSTNGPFGLQIFPGDHFFVASSRESVIQSTVTLLRHAPRPRPSSLNKWPSMP